MRRIKLPVFYSTLNRIKKREVRAEYVRLQWGMCPVCRGSLDEPSQLLEVEVDLSLFPKGFFDYPLHLHHDHKTGLTMSVLHAHCNAIEWQYRGR
jgi:hypothetical protein